MISEPQFGRPEPGAAPRERPAAFCVVEDGGRIALVKITTGRTPPFFDLPGGALDEGETAQAAGARELIEETGLVVEVGALVGAARQHFRLGNGEAVNNHCRFHAARIVGHDPAGKIEDDHELVWKTPLEALGLLRHEAHAWAVVAWMRQTHAPDAL